MARSILVVGPSGMSSPKATFVPLDDSTETEFTLTERTNAKGVYDNSALTVDAGYYNVVIYDGSTFKGVFYKIHVSGNDGEVVVIDEDAQAGRAVLDARLRDWQNPGTFGAYLQGSNRYTNPESNLIQIRRNDAYDGSANAVLSFTVTKDFTSGWSGTLTIKHRKTNAVLLSKAVTIVDATTIEVSLDTSDTGFAGITTDAGFGPHPYDIEMENGSGAKQTAVAGVANVLKDTTTA